MAVKNVAVLTDGGAIFIGKMNDEQCEGAVTLNDANAITKYDSVGQALSSMAYGFAYCEQEMCSHYVGTIYLLKNSITAIVPDGSSKKKCGFI